MLFAGTMAAICQLQALSPVGRCKTFDESADGYGRGEGLASIVLQAFEGNKAAIGIITGSAANQVSKTTSSTIFFYCTIEMLNVLSSFTGLCIMKTVDPTTHNNICMYSPNPIHV